MNADISGKHIKIQISAIVPILILATIANAGLVSFIVQNLQQKTVFYILYILHQTCQTGI